MSSVPLSFWWEETTITKARLLNCTTIDGVTFTYPHKFVAPLSKRKYTVRKFKYKKTMTKICFYDIVSNSFLFGFKIRKYRNGNQVILPDYLNNRILYPAFSKKTISPECYKEVIKELKSKVKHIN